MMNDFVFYNPVKMYFGKNQLEKLPTVVEEYGKKILLVYGGSSIKKNGLYDEIISLLYDRDIFELAGIQSNPDIESVRKGAELCRQNDIEVILAAGGGSVIDAAKWIAAAVCVEHDPWDFFCKKTSIDNALPLITISTTAATGSDMNNGGVISNRELGKKIGRSSSLLYPRASFLNPETTFSVGKYQTSCGSIDILSHVMEVYFSKQDTIEMLENIMEGIMKTAIKYGKIAFNNPNDYDARSNLMWAASWAINGFLNGGVRQAWNCHTIEHELSARYNITHGHGLAIIIPVWLRYCYTSDDGYKYLRFANNVLDIKAEKMSDRVLDQIITSLNDLFFNEFELDSKLRTFIENKDDIEDIAKTICEKGPITGFATLNEEDIVNILNECY